MAELREMRFGAAYLTAVTDELSKPAKASYEKPAGTPSSNQRCFWRRLIKTYNAESDQLLEVPEEYQTTKIWCPISGKAFDLDVMKAAHIVPCSIGEANAAYLLGRRPEDGFEVLWSEKNGLLMHSLLKTIFDDGRMVIIPDPADNNEFITIVLSKDLMDRDCRAVDDKFGSLHKKRLQFQTDARPGKRYLYMHALLTVARRRRFDVPGWQADQEQVFNGEIWASPGKWARKSMVTVLALGVGDGWKVTAEEMLGMGEALDTKPPEDEEREE